MQEIKNTEEFIVKKLSWIWILEQATYETKKIKWLRKATFFYLINRDYLYFLNMEVSDNKS